MANKLNRLIVNFIGRSPVAGNCIDREQGDVLIFPGFRQGKFNFQLIPIGLLLNILVRLSCKIGQPVNELNWELRYEKFEV
jgi:hypothetical protein